MNWNEIILSPNSVVEDTSERYNLIADHAPSSAWSVFFIKPEMKLSTAIYKFVVWKSLKATSLTTKGYEISLRQFCLYMRDCDIEAVGLNDVIEWFGLMAHLRWDSNSFIPKAMALRKFFEFYQHQGFQVVDPYLIPFPAKRFKIPRVADKTSYEKLLAVIPRNNDPRHIRNLAIVKMLWDTGARNGEICSLDISDVDTEKMKAVIMTEKNRGSRPYREILWTDDTNEALLCWLRKREKLECIVDEEALFIGISTNHSGQRIKIKGIGEMLRHYSNKAGIPTLNAHSFRHGFGHEIINKGGSVADVQNLLGHTSPYSAATYTRMFGQELEARYRKFRGEVLTKPEGALNLINENSRSKENGSASKREEY